MEELAKIPRWFMKGNGAGAKCARTMAQGVLGVVAGIAAYYAGNDPMAALVTCPIVMAIVSPLQALLGEDMEDPKGKHVKTE